MTWLWGYMPNVTSLVKAILCLEQDPSYKIWTIHTLMGGAHDRSRVVCVHAVHQARIWHKGGLALGSVVFLMAEGRGRQQKELQWSREAHERSVIGFQGTGLMLEFSHNQIQRTGQDQGGLPMQDGELAPESKTQSFWGTRFWQLDQNHAESG